MSIIILGNNSYFRNDSGDSYLNKVDFFSDYSLLDAYFVVWDLAGSISELSRYEKKELITKKDYIILKRQFDQRREEIREFVSLGRTLFIEMHSNYAIEVKVSSDAYYNVHTFDFMSLLELKKPKIHTKHGTNIGYASNTIETSLLEHCKDYLKYYCTFTDVEGEPFLKIRGTKHIVGQYIKKETGAIFLLPKFEYRPFQHDQAQEFTDIYIVELIQLFKHSQKPLSENKPAPKWLEQISLLNELNDKEKYKELLKQKLELEQLIISQENILQNHNELKVLVYGDGDKLEKVCERVFKDIGYIIEAVEPGRDDLIIRHEKEVAVVEIKGLKGSAAEKNANQLMKWVTNYHDAHEVDPKGILIVNTYKETPLFERTDIDFPNQMIPFCKKREICLVTGKELLNIYLGFKAGLLTIDAVTRLLFDTVGILKSGIEIIEEIKQE